jgi:predicted short-subunit dehydrogenase-like oxidoreductase (DUF2520 family)
MTSPFTPDRVAVVGAGRLGTALASALPAAGPFGRGCDGAGHDVVLLCVPDAEIAAAAAAVVPRPGLLVGHCSGATGLGALAPHEAFSLHPLMAVPREGADLRGAGGAVAGGTPRALGAARALAERLGLRVVEVADADRAAYHAAASAASNFLVTLEDAAERLLPAGAGRELLVPLVRATVEHWAALGPERALTGPIARGDAGTVARQRAAVQDRLPELLGVWDELAAATARLAARPPGSAPVARHPRPVAAR